MRCVRCMLPEDECDCAPELPDAPCLFDAYPNEDEDEESEDE